MDIDFRWAGSIHDTKVFANSVVNQKIRDRLLPLTYQKLIPGRTKSGNHLICDPTYPLTPYGMKEH